MVAMLPMFGASSRVEGPAAAAYRKLPAAASEPERPPELEGASWIFKAALQDSFLHGEVYPSEDRLAWLQRSWLRRALRLRFTYAFFVSFVLCVTLAVGTFTTVFASFQYACFRMKGAQEGGAPSHVLPWTFLEPFLRGSRGSNVFAIWFLPITIIIYAWVANHLFHLMLDSLRDALPTELLERLATPGSPTPGAGVRSDGDRMRDACSAIVRGFFSLENHDWAASKVSSFIFFVLEGLPMIVLVVCLTRNKDNWWRFGEWYEGYFAGLLMSTVVITTVLSLSHIWAACHPYVRRMMLSCSRRCRCGPQAPEDSGSDLTRRRLVIHALSTLMVWTVFEFGLICYVSILSFRAYRQPLTDFFYFVLYVATFVFWMYTLWRFTAAVLYTFRSTLKSTFVCTIIAVVVYGLAETVVNTLNKVDDLNPQVETSVMSVNLSAGGLPRSWTPAPGFKPYPICGMSWGASSAPLSAVDLGAISVLAYEPDCARIIPALARDSFSRPVKVLNCSDLTSVPRMLALRFPPPDGSKKAGGTIVLAFKGTNTPVDVSTDSAIYAMLSILSILSTSVVPATSLLPSELLSEILYRSRPDFLDDMLNQVTTAANSLRREHPEDHVVLTGHSLGGMFAAIAAARTGLDALVWSAPGNKFLAKAFRISVQAAKKYVAIVPDNDLFARADVHLGVEQRIECRDRHGKQLTREDAIDCHDPRRSVCEVWRTCGDVEGRNFRCRKFLEPEWLGRGFPDDLSPA